MNKEMTTLQIEDKDFSYNSSHVNQHTNVVGYLEEALHKILPELNSAKNGSYLKKTVDLHKVLGKREVIEVNGDEDIFYAQRKGRRTMTKFVRDLEAQDCSCITFLVHKVDNKKFKILTAYVGYAAEKEPLDPAIKTEEEFNRAKAYWEKTAMIEGTQEILPHTITTTCPWDTFENRIIINLGNKNEVDIKPKSGPKL